MKTKNLLLTAVIFIYTAGTLIAQNPNNTKPFKDIPFGIKMPPPNVTNHASGFSQQMVQPHTNNAFMHGMTINDATALKKDPKQLRQQLLAKLPPEFFQRKNAQTITGGNKSAANSNFHLTKDIDALTESYPANFHDLLPNTTFAILDNVVYFRADDGVHGYELWRSDGTDGGTYMVKDIVPGAGSPFGYWYPNITAVNGKIYFAAYTADNGLEPWVSDGTENGTHLLKDTKPGGLSSYPTEFYQVGNKTFFITDGDIYSSAQFWETDGTEAGTKLVVSLDDEFGLTFITQPKVVNGLLYFTVYNTSTGYYELWRSDGTKDGSYHIGTGTSFLYIPAQLTNYDNKLYFSADDGSGRELWVTDGTDAGTMPAPGNHDIFVNADYISSPFTKWNGALYISGQKTLSDGFYVNGALYKYDASDGQGLVKVKNIAPNGDTAFIAPIEMKVLDDKVLFFIVTSYAGGAHNELWYSYGSNAVTGRVEKYTSQENAHNLTVAGSNLYFIKGNDKTYGTELWKINSGGPLPKLVSNIFKGATSSSPNYLTAVGSELFFSATDKEKGTELFMTDGTNKGTALVKDINTVSTSSSGAGYSGFAALDKNVLFTAFENVHGDELYKSDGTHAGTDLLNDITSGEGGSYGDEYLSKNNAVYFRAIDYLSLSSAIYKTDGTQTGLQKITPDYNANYYALLNFVVADNGVAFYVVYDYLAFTYNLWRSDGTAAGTFLLSTTLYYLNYLNVADNTAFFVAGDNTHGNELWKSDGSIAGTKLVKDINVGLSDAFPGGMFVYKNEVYFGAYDGVNHAFWKSDGTKSGTIQLKNIDPWWGGDAVSTGQFFCISNDILYFSAINYSNGKGTVLWKTDGTPAGTQPIKDINPTDGSVALGPYLLTDVNGTVFFTADDGVHGSELWKTDGTSGGTKIVKDITPGIDPSYIFGLTSFAGKLFFANFSFTDANYYLWSSDGTAHGTQAVTDPGISNVAVNLIFAGSDKLFISGFTSKYGLELYAGTVEDGDFASVKNESTATTNSFNAFLYPNPAASQATLQITGETKNVSVSITDANGKKLWQSTNGNTAIMKLPVEKLAPGIYMITVTSGKESKTIKLVKH